MILEQNILVSHEIHKNVEASKISCCLTSLGVCVVHLVTGPYS